MSDDLMKDYNALLKRSKDLAIIGSAGAILQWDLETKMPPGAVELKSQQLALIQKIGHQMLTDPENGRLLDRIEKNQGYSGFSELKKRNVHLSRKAYDENTKLPEELVVEIAKQQTIGVATWKKAKAAKDWNMFKPELAKMIELQKKKAELLMDVKGAKTPYDALIDNFEPRMTANTITKLFDEMKKGLKKVLDRVLSEEKPEIGFLSRPVSASIQEKIGKSLADYVLYDIKSEKAMGRIDTTEHPFTTGYYTDVRITTHYHEEQFASSIFSVLHEAGHALYELGLPREWMYQPVGTASSYGVHESMSRFIENYVGKSPEFWEYYLPELQKLTGDTFKDVTKEQMVKAVNYVTPSKIRIEADEVTYGLHIVIRFEIERDIFAGKLTVDELPEAWNQKYKDYLGVDIENDSEGVMQDTHWAIGYFGYFPSYALGNLYDGILVEKLSKDLPDWNRMITAGNFKDVKDWLTDNVYKYGNLYDPEDLAKHVTGKPLQVKPFIDYLDAKFKAIYSL
ncbi:MAG: carboxypeptidase M32 [Candidatus Bathyarchaeota archaeon]|nr:carboxypeptidase M32 [Candidatus Bathyarchaeota archaeon]